MSAARFSARLFLVLALTLAPGCKRQYYSRVRVEYGAAGTSRAPVADAEKVLRDLLPKGDESVQLQSVGRTGLFDIGVFSPDPKAAADRANQLAVWMQKTLNSNPAAPVFRIWEKAEPSPLAR